MVLNGMKSITAIILLNLFSVSVHAGETKSDMRFKSIYSKKETKDPSYYKELISSSLPYIKTSKSEVEKKYQKDFVVEESSFPVQINLNERLHIEFLMDEGKDYQYVVNEFLDKSKMSKEQLLERSIDNLWSKIESGLKVYPVGNVKGLVMGGDFEASLFIIDQLWDKSFADKSKGEIIVAIPARDMITFGYSKVESTIDELNAIINRTWKNGDQLITKQLYIRKNSNWVEFQLSQ
jgi:uncharacterized protein YtpQ (UPF0354 family)